MQVSAQYAESHLEELLDATEKGEVIEIARPSKASVKLTLVPAPAPAPKKVDRTGMFGSGKGKIWMAEDWDSPEVNEEIARLFNEGSIFPDQP
jgi:antitoxin (DNA-binding transcriptional repressor) of toxin-antitoxin stability system